MRTVNDWLNEYGESHKNETNKLIHWLCVPAIFFSIIGLLYSVKLPWEIKAGFQLNMAIIVALLAILYYFRLSPPLAVGLVLFIGLCFFLCRIIEINSPVSLWVVSVAIFILAWAGQFYGHKIEGKKPSFLKDIQFLLIGPMWLMSFIYRKLGFRF
ncbi:DUF962 domain-containing protein [soil metagenome]